MIRVQGSLRRKDWGDGLEISDDILGDLALGFSYWGRFGRAEVLS